MLQVLCFVWLPFANFFAFYGVRRRVCVLHSFVSIILEQFAITCWLT